MSMREYFEHAYGGVCNTMQDFAGLASDIAEVAKVLFVYATMPLWLIPYAIYKKVRTSHGCSDVSGGDAESAGS